jgi:hypothetical protein
MTPFRTILPSLLVGAVTACSAAGSDSRSPGANPQGTGAGTGTGDPSAGGSGGGLLLGNGGHAMVSVGGMQCAADVHAAEGLPLDMFIMMDQSGSMNEKVSGGSKWTAVTGALSTFVQSQKTVGLSAGDGSA